MLADQPGIGRLGRVAATREPAIPGSPYILPYVEEGDAVVILRVIHLSIKWPEKFWFLSTEKNTFDKQFEFVKWVDPEVMEITHNVALTFIQFLFR